MTSSPAREDLAVPQRALERRRVDDRTARRVHEHRGRLHRAQGVVVDQVLRLVGQVDVQADEVGLAQQVVHLDAARPELRLLLRRRRMHVVVEDPHPEAATAARHLAADAPEPDDPERRAVDVDAHQQHRPPRAPAAVANVVDPLGDPARGRHEQGEREVGGRLGQDAGRVAGRDAAPGAGVDVDVVEADREVAHDLQLRAGRVEKLVVDRIGEEGEEAVLAGRPPQQLVARRRQLVGPQVDLGGLADRVEPLVGDDPGDEHARPIGHAAPTSSPVRSSLASESPMRSSAAARFSREFA